MTDSTLPQPIAAGLRRDADPDAQPGAAPAQPKRVAESAGLGRVDRTRTLSFRWGGRTLQGHPGDTLAAALLANDVRIVGRSFKYHRPRGVMSAGVEEGGAIVTVGEGARRTPNVNAATQELFDGLVAHGQNAWPSVERDLGSINDLGSPFLKAGFYYKTFFSFLPRVVPSSRVGTDHWMRYEALIRRAAGMGRASDAPDPDLYETVHAHCDALVVGSGPAGLEAARLLAEAGQDVVLVEQDFELGGRLLHETRAIEGAPAEDWRRDRLAKLSSLGVRMLSRTTAFGLYDHGVAGLVERVSDNAPKPEPDQVRERVWIVRAARTVLATGAIERGIAFGNNDRPGVMGAEAARIYLNRYGVRAGAKAVVATAHDGGWRAAAELAAAGAEVTLLDARDVQIDAPAGVTVRTQCAPRRALGARGVTGLEIARQTGAGWRAEDRIEAELIAVAGGWSPSVALLSHRGVKPVWNERRHAFLPGPTPPGIEVCGRAAGLEDPTASAVSGRNAARRALGRAEKASEEPIEETEETPRAFVYEVRAPGAPAKAFVDPQHDVTSADIRLAHQEGYVSVEHLKRYTTLGMATDQGKVGNVLGLALMAEARGVDIAEVGTTTFRPPYTPVSIGALAGRARGRHVKPERRTPMHAWNLARGAQMTDAGLWKRPWFYPRAGETIDDACVREAATARKTVALCDVTSLGKIAVQGPDAAEFLNRIYVNGFAKLPIGRARYGVMLREDGVAMDDGTVWRMGETDYYMTTTTAAAGKVMSWLEELLQTRWSDLRVAVCSVTEQWAGLSVAGPHARNLLSALVADIDFSDEAFPYMGVREGTLGGRPVRLARISFSGALAYEIHIESDYAEAMAETLWEGARALGGCLYGTEALGTLRIEKGFVTHAEIDGRTTLSDLGLGAMASKTKPYIGAALKDRPATADPSRPRLVGLIPVDKDAVFKSGAILCRPDAVKGHGIGWVSSVTHSPALGHWIGLGLVEGGVEAWEGQTILAAYPVRSDLVHVKVVSPVFVDPEGHALKPEQDPVAPSLRPAPDRLARRLPSGADWPEDAHPGAARAIFGRGGPGGALEDFESPETDRQDRPVWLVEGAPKPLWRISAWPEAAHALEARLADALGVAPPAPGRRISGAVAALSRVAPRVWLQEGGAAPALDPEEGAVLSLEHALARIVIGGPRAADLLARFVSVDLRPAAFPVGAIAGVDIHHTAAVLARTDERRFALWLPRSYRHGLWLMLEETARQWR
ncbi:MAG: sarcosine oxidase subunit alpha family protein [Pseudomonadota bacterium]